MTKAQLQTLFLLAMTSLHQIANGKRNNDARRNARATVGFIDTQRQTIYRRKKAKR